LKGGNGCVDVSVGTLGSDTEDEEGEVGDVGEEASLPELFFDGAGAKDAVMEVFVRI
jgi:hypothetical protein